MHNVGVAAHDDVGFEFCEVIRGVEVAFFGDGAVAGDDCFVSILAGVVGVAEEVIAGEGDPFAVEFEPEAAAEFGLSGHPVDLECESFPVDAFAGLDAAVDGHAIKAIAVGGDEGSIIVVAGVFTAVGDHVECPCFCAVFFAEHGAE